MQIFITGTGTSIGKTMISSWLIYQLNIIKDKNYFYWKPIQSGVDTDDDTKFVSQFTNNIYQPLYSFSQPLAPHLAAKLNHTEIIMEQLLHQKPDNPNLIIEGAGGILVPINESEMIVDLIIKLRIPVIIVSDSELGTINHTCLTLEALRIRNIKIFGVIMNGKKNYENKLAIEKFGKTKVLQEIELFEDWNGDFQLLKRAFNAQPISSDLSKLFQFSE